MAAVQAKFDDRSNNQPISATTYVGRMDDAGLAGAVRALRHRRGWRQADLAARARISPSQIGVLESGRLEQLSLPVIRRVAAALGIRLRWDASFRGPELARLRDADHARLTEFLVRRLEALGWLVVVEASFNHYGERGRVDVLAYEPRSRRILVIEVKTLIVEVQAILGGLSVKTRVASGLARELGWRPAAIVPALVVRDSTTNRRRLAEHERLFARLPLRGRSARSWLAQPTGAPDGLLVMIDLPNPSHTGGRRAGRQRVRRSVGRARSGRWPAAARAEH